MSLSLSKRLSNAWRALRGGEEKKTGSAPAPSEVEPTELGGAETALAKARLELEATKAECERLREEYARRDRQASEEVGAAGRAALLKLARRVGPLLSQFVTMRVAVAEGKPVRIEDLLTMAGKLEKAFAEVGIIPVGEVGGSAAFDPKVHQRMSGGDVSDGDSVRVRFVGYACGEAVVTKAMVSREE